MGRTTAPRSISFDLPRADRGALAELPWQAPLEGWPALGVQAIYARRGESRHTVLFVEAEGRRYAIKETSPEAARKEINQLIEIRQRGIYALEPVGVVVAPGPPIAVGKIAGVTQYLPGDLGYCVTRLAQRVIPQALLYRYPFTRRNREMLWNAIIALLLNLHERGIFWGDPSLANTLIDLSQHKVRALLADAETVELYSGPLDEHRRQEDLAALQESLLWTGEDIRQSRDAYGPLLITQEDTAYIARHYAALRQVRHEPEAAAQAATPEDSGAEAEHIARPLTPVERVAGQLYELGYSILDISWRAILATGDTLRSRALAAHAETARPRWYQQRIQDALGVHIPRPYARQFYRHLVRHQWLMSERANHDIPLEEAARDWYERYHLPAITLLRAYFPSESDSLEVYLGVLDRKWELSLRAGFETNLEEAALDYALRHARSAALLHRAFTAVASLLPQRSELRRLVRPEDQQQKPAPPTA
ncbi:MAG TPA: DUF4032 domain-containing protein [Ktedonobacterales bacterium]|jgi:hypothetical protein